jgi:tryptophan synthase beta chain
MPALEPCHAIAYLMQQGTSFPADALVLLILSGRGDKDIYSYAKATGTDVSGVRDQTPGVG